MPASICSSCAICCSASAIRPWRAARVEPLQHPVDVALRHHPAVGVERRLGAVADRLLQQRLEVLADRLLQAPATAVELLAVEMAGALGAVERAPQRLPRRLQRPRRRLRLMVLEMQGQRPHPRLRLRHRGGVGVVAQQRADRGEVEEAAGIARESLGRDRAKGRVGLGPRLGMQAQHLAHGDHGAGGGVGEGALGQGEDGRRAASLQAGRVLGAQRRGDRQAGPGMGGEVTQRRPRAATSASPSGSGIGTTTGGASGRPCKRSSARSSVTPYWSCAVQGSRTSSRAAPAPGGRRRRRSGAVLGTIAIVQAAISRPRRRIASRPPAVSVRSACQLAASSARNGPPSPPSESSGAPPCRRSR